MYDIFFKFILAGAESPLGAVTVLVLLSAFGYGLYRWIHRKPKAPGTEQHAGGGSAGGAT